MLGTETDTDVSKVELRTLVLSVDSCWLSVSIFPLENWLVLISPMISALKKNHLVTLRQNQYS